MRKILTGLTILVIAFSTAMAISSDEFTQQWDAVEGKAAKIEVAKSAVADADDIDVIRGIQDTWKEYNRESAVEFFQSLLSQDESARNLYLVGRLQDSSVDKIEYARRAIAVDPEFIYGYRLLCVTYENDLYDGDEDGEYYAALKGTFSRDLPVIRQATELLEDNAEAWGYYNDALAYQNDFTGQLEVLQKGKELGARWAGVQSFTNAYVGLGDYERALANLDEALAEQVEAGDLEAEYVDDYQLYRYSRALEAADAWDEAVRFFSEYDGEELKPLATVYLAAAYQHKGDEDAMYAALENAIQLGFDSQMELADMSEFEPYKEAERWHTIEAAVKDNWVKNTPKRREEALAKKMNLPAPELTMKKVDGSIISLADLKGQVVVIDFWATWCGPCRMAMPEIDKVTERYAEKDVTIISLNVWENVPEKAKKFMIDNEYDMQLMWPEGEVSATDLFEVTGIPTMVVLDKDGVIRFKEVGFEEGLEEKLGWLVDDLLFQDSQSIQIQLR